MMKSFNKLFLHTNLSLLYQLNRVNFLTNVVSDVSKHLKNRHIVLVFFIKKNMLKFVYKLFLHTNSSSLVSELNSVNFLTYLVHNIF